jgi:cobalt-zinc-cadmium efflux system membrane fusion protein
MRRLSCLALLTIALAILLTGCGERESAREVRAMKDATPQRLRPDGTIQLSDQDRAALGLVVASAAEGDLPESTLRFGRVVSLSANEGQVVSPVSGRVTHPPLAQLGSSVKAGAVLLEIAPALDTPDRIAVGTQAAEREGQIAVAAGELAQAEAGATRARQLSPHIVSTAKLQEAETAVAAVRARLEGLRNARTAASQAQTNPVAVSAPIAGTVAAIKIEVGALVNKGDILAQVVREGPVWIDVSVPPDDPIGDRYAVNTSSGLIAARLLARGSVIDADGTRHDRLIVDAAQSAALRPGASVSVQVAHGASRGIVIAAAALVPGVDTDIVFVETAPGVFAARPVQVAARFEKQVRVASGVSAGNRVVVQGAMALQGERLRSQLRQVE